MKIAYNNSTPHTLKSSVLQFLSLSVPAKAVGLSAVSFSAALRKDAAAIPDAWEAAGSACLLLERRRKNVECKMKMSSVQIWGW